MKSFDLETFIEAKNSHDVPKKVIEHRLKDFKPIIPLYFGWFLNETETKLITDMAFDIYGRCLSASSKFKTDLMKMSRNG